MTLSRAATPLIRTAARGGVTLRPAADPARFLRHAPNGQVTLGARATVFRLS